jgi:hypothetical protein
VKMAAKKLIVKVIQPKSKPDPRDTSEIELILATPIEVSKKFCLSDLPASSQIRRDKGHHAVQTIGEQAPCMITFNNLGDDSSSDVHEASPPLKVADALPPPPPFMPGELSCRAFADLF